MLLTLLLALREAFHTELAIMILTMPDGGASTVVVARELKPTIIR